MGPKSTSSKSTGSGIGGRTRGNASRSSTTPAGQEDAAGTPATQPLGGIKRKQGATEETQNDEVSLLGEEDSGSLNSGAQAMREAAAAFTNAANAVRGAMSPPGGVPSAPAVVHNVAQLTFHGTGDMQFISDVGYLFVYN